MRSRASFTLFLVALLMQSFAFGADQQPGKCDVGPLHMTYGKVPWLVYSCTTDKNVVIVSAPGSPAMPFVFCFCMTEGSYRLYGEGTGNKGLTDAAFKDLHQFTAEDIAGLIQQTKQVKQLKQESVNPLP
jgi:hypothetical protein